MEVRSQFFPPCTELKRLAHMTQALPRENDPFVKQILGNGFFHSRFVWYSWALVSGLQKPRQTTLEIVPIGYLPKRTPISVADLFPATIESRPGRPTLGWPLTTIQAWLGRSKGMEKVCVQKVLSTMPGYHQMNFRSTIAPPTTVE